ncbi:HpcH/HpaI aldolase family protein [Acidimangrovimonas sediminis]|uniref:HpcH/HpaI aldolase family protein n=1 Tax=Acidimangrovimonas sediminis TaxID=2056283 RepID=UPI000C80D8F9|nr:HpcH/HpaI aldolase/citrate lyase family protein [Acidimangrovimonas sediminis]
MDMPKNAFKAAIGAGRRQIGIWTSIAEPGSVEMLAGCGYEWMLIDTEHTTTSIATAQQMLQAVAPYPVSPVVRPGWNDPVEIKRLLDAGAQSLLIPYVQNAEEARAAVAAVRYPPQGFRGMAGMTRASRWGAVDGYLAKAADEICLLVQVETAEALSHIEEIAAVEGVDGIFIGPADLSASMGYPGDQKHPEVKRTILEATARIRKAGLPPGILSTDQEFLREAETAGAQFIAIGIDTEMLRGNAVARRKLWAD